MWDLSGPGVKPMSPCIGRRILNPRITREVPFFIVVWLGVLPLCQMVGLTFLWIQVAEHRRFSRRVWWENSTCFLPHPLPLPELQFHVNQSHICRKTHCFLSCYCYYSKICRDKFNMENQQGPAGQHREVCSILCNNLMVTRGKGGGGIVRESGIYMHTLLCLTWRTSKDLLASPGNSAQCYVAAWMGGEMGENGYIVNVLYPNTEQKF